MTLCVYIDRLAPMKRGFELHSHLCESLVASEKTPDQNSCCAPKESHTFQQKPSVEGYKSNVMEMLI